MSVQHSSLSLVEEKISCDLQFPPKSYSFLDGRVVDVNADDMLNKIIKLYMIKRQNNLHLIVMFDDQPPYNHTDRHVLTKLLAFDDELTVGSVEC